jgi:phosphoglycolate phosphatase
VGAVFDAVLFDLDGTLTDPASGITGSFRHALATVGHPVADDIDLTWMIGPSMRENLVRHGLPDDLHDSAIDAYRARHLEVGLYDATLHAGAVELLDALSGAGIAVALATAKPVPQAVRTLEHFGIADRFTVVAGATPNGHTVGKVSIVADALAQLGRPARAAMVGDRRHDVEAGRATGCTTIAVQWGYAEAGELDAIGPDHRVDSFAALAALVIA